MIFIKYILQRKLLIRNCARILGCKERKYVTGWNILGSDWGCCGNYDGCCMFANDACYLHDRMCTCCDPRWLCFSGCKLDSECSLENSSKANLSSVSDYNIHLTK